MSPHDYDSVRRQLDSLLGPDRNKIPGEDARQSHPNFVGYSDPSVCKGYLLGLCLSTLSVKRRGCMMSCDKVHSDEARREFNDADQNGRVLEKRRWQQDLADECRVVVNDEDRRIQVAAHRLKLAYGFEEPASAIVVKDLSVLQSLGLLVNGIPSTVVESASDGEKDVESRTPGPIAGTKTTDECDDAVGSGSASMEIRIIGADTPKNQVHHADNTGVKESSFATPVLSSDAAVGEEGKRENRRIDEAKDKLAPTVDSALPARHRIGEGGRSGPGGLLLCKNYKQRVCGQCGGLFSLYDAETRLASHFSGKQHTSLVAVREKLHQLEESLRGSYDVNRRWGEGVNSTPRPQRGCGPEPWESRGRRPRSSSPRWGRFNEERESGALPSIAQARHGGLRRQVDNDRSSKRHRGHGRNWNGMF